MAGIHLGDLATPTPFHPLSYGRMTFEMNVMSCFIFGDLVGIVRLLYLDREIYIEQGFERGPPIDIWKDPSTDAVRDI